MPVEHQVISIYAGTRGYLDDLPLDKVADFEERMLFYLEHTHSEIPEGIRTEKKLTDDLEKKLKSVLDDFLLNYKEGRAPDPRADKSAKPADAAPKAEEPPRNGRYQPDRLTGSTGTKPLIRDVGSRRRPRRMSNGCP